jgi:hypothetical protein
MALSYTQRLSNLHHLKAHSKVPLGATLDRDSLLPRINRRTTQGSQRARLISSIPFCAVDRHSDRLRQNWDAAEGGATSGQVSLPSAAGEGAFVTGVLVYTAIDF